jgi:hypothetical protein
MRLGEYGQAAKPSVPCHMFTFHCGFIAGSMLLMGDRKLCGG